MHISGIHVAIIASDYQRSMSNKLTNKLTNKRRHSHFDKHTVVALRPPTC